MEPRPRAAQTLGDHADGAGRLRTALRLLSGCVLMTGLAFTQSAGLLVADTKFDLAVDPGAFLGRATHLWDGLGAFGQLQNQAYGYLWPMGPFFWAGDVLGAPGWAVQRGWLALVMSTAFLGAALLTRRLGVRSDLALVVAGTAYALSPRMLTVLGPISIEAWPSALAPWVLLPLVIGSSTGSPRRAAALSALAVAMVGGVNAAATFAVIPLGALWLLTRSPGARRRSMMLWWPSFVLIGTLWWLVPLFVLGAYSPPFLDYIEAAANTTFSTTAFDALRGTSNWVPYVDTSSRAGNDLLRDLALALMSGVVLAAGVFGLAHRRTPHARFLALGVVAGLLMVTFGHLGSTQGWFAVGANGLLDGVLAPLRNVHKYDPVLRVPLVVGLAWTVQLLRDQLAGIAAQERPPLEERLRQLRLRVVVGSVLTAVLAASAPALAGRITPAGATFSVPEYWSEAAAWLQRRDRDGSALLVPGSSFASYVWGAPRDEPLQYLEGGRTRWAVRNAVPLAPAGNIRMLDAIEARFAQGRGSTGLAPYLARAGIGYLVVRNDLARRSDVPDPVLVHQALDGSPGLRRVASFGPEVGGEATLSRRGQRVVINGGWQSEYPAVEVYAVSPSAERAASVSDPPVVVGGPEDLLDLVDLDVLDDGPSVLATDAGEGRRPRELVLTDGLRAVGRNFGRVHDAASATLERGESRRSGDAERDYLLPGADRWSTWAELEGAASVTASSSTSDALALGATQPGQAPYAALDGSGATWWRANYRADEQAWWQVRFEAPRAVTQVRLRVGEAEREVLRVRAGSESARVVVPAGGTRTVQLGAQDAETLRVEDASGRRGHRPTLVEVDADDLDVERRLRLPAVPEQWGNPDALVLRTVSDARRGCAVVDDEVRCRADQAVAGEEEQSLRRAVSLPQPGIYELELTAQLRGGSALAERVLSEQPVNVTASSTGTPDPRGSVLAAVDGDASTTWTAGETDAEPLLGLNWVDERTLSGIQVVLDPDVAAGAPARLVLTWPGGRREVELDEDGEAEFAPLRTSQLTVRVESTRPASGLDFDSRPSRVPVGITELRLEGLPYLPVAVPDEETTLPCGSGPAVVVNGEELSTSVTASLDQVSGQDRVAAQVCGSAQVVALPAGESSIDVEASELFVPRSLVLRRPGASLPLGSSGETRDVEVPSPVERTFASSGTDEGVVTRENSNPGWIGSQAGRTSEAVVVDGWQQGWRSRPGVAAPVRSVFAPDTVYRSALLAGLLLLAGLTLLVALRPARRWGLRHLPAVRERPLPWWSPAALSLGFAGLVAGWVGAGLAVGALALVTLLRRWSPALLPVVAAALVLPAAAAYAVRPWGGEAGWAGSLVWPHYLVVVTVVVVLTCATARSAPRRPVPPSRMPGSSTTR